MAGTKPKRKKPPPPPARPTTGAKAVTARPPWRRQIVTKQREGR